MEYLNKIELKGVVGNVRINEFQGLKVANFSLVTKYDYQKKDGSIISENTWHNVVAWEGGEIDVEEVKKGAKLYIIGRLRCNRYTGADGVEKMIYEIIASYVREIEE